MFQMQEPDSTSPDIVASCRTGGGEGEERSESGEAEVKKELSKEERRVAQKTENQFERDIRQFRISTTECIREGENRMAEMTDRQIVSHMMDMFVSECWAELQESDSFRKRDKYRSMVTSTVDGDGKEEGSG